MMYSLIRWALSNHAPEAFLPVGLTHYFEGFASAVERRGNPVHHPGRSQIVQVRSRRSLWCRKAWWGKGEALSRVVRSRSIGGQLIVAPSTQEPL